MTDQIALITHNEAGHAVAALTTKDTVFDEDVTVTVTVINGRGAGTNVLLLSGHPVQDAFIVYAGPWAEARVQRGEPVRTLDDADNNGRSFREAVTAAFNDAPHL